MLFLCFATVRFLMLLSGTRLFWWMFKGVVKTLVWLLILCFGFGF